jgi:hypothetical protein
MLEVVSVSDLHIGATTRLIEDRMYLYKIIRGQKSIGVILPPQ